MQRAVLAGALWASLVCAGGASADPGRHKHGKPPVEGVLNVNRASEAELRLLPGIGRGRAATIVARRQSRPFASLEEVARIKGMRRLVARLRSHLAIDGPTTLRPAASAQAGPTGSGPPARAP